VTEMLTKFLSAVAELQFALGFLLLIFWNVLKQFASVSWKIENSLRC